MITLQKIADICGVSIATVSKALRDKPGVQPKIRERVLSVAQQHNYRPNRLVHAIRSGRSMTIGVLCSHFGEEFSGAILDSIFDVMDEAHYDVLLAKWNRRVHQNKLILQRFQERRVDGILLFPPVDHSTAPYFSELQSFSHPIVVVDQAWPDTGFDFIGSQDAEGAFLLTEHLIKLGHRDIANLHYRHSSTGKERLNGFQRAMIRHGVAVHEQWLREICDYESSEAHTHALELLSSHNRPTAIVAFNDAVAIQVLAAADDLGLDVPSQLSVVGFADLGIVRSRRPRLTTVSQHPDRIGRNAAERLLARIKMREEKKERGPQYEHRVEVELQVRGTSTPPRLSTLSND